jgi:hypothetical protein
MKYFLPAVMAFALALPVTAHAAGGRDCGPHLPQQLEQAKKSGEYALELEKGQLDQAKKSAEYALELEKGQLDQAKKSAEYEVELAKGQADQARKSAEYAVELAKGQADQAKKSAEYAAQLDAEQRKVLQYYASLCGEQTSKYSINIPPPKVREAAMEKPLKGFTGGDGKLPPPPLPETAGLPTAPGSPVTENNALTDPKKELNKALGEIQGQ